MEIKKVYCDFCKKVICDGENKLQGVAGIRISGRAGWGSKYDEESCCIDLCDDCYTKQILMKLSDGEFNG